MNYLQQQLKKSADILFILCMFIAAIYAERKEMFSLLEDQTLSARHILRTTFGDSNFFADLLGLEEKVDKDLLQLSSDVLLVTLDEDFFTNYGTYPLRRTDIGKIVTNLSQLGAKVIALDILFDFSSSYGEDPAFAESLAAAGNTLLVSQGVFVDGKFSHINYPTELLREAATKTGYTNIQSMSAIVTSISRLTIYPEITKLEDGWPFAIQALSMYLDVEPVWQDDQIQLGDISIPLDPLHNLIIDYPALPPGSLFLSDTTGLSAQEFLDMDDLDEDELLELRYWVEGKIVVLGDTSAVSHDIFDTPVGQVYGMEIIADTISTLLKNVPLRPLPNSLEIVVAITVMVLLLLSIKIVKPLLRLGYTLLLFGTFISLAVLLYIFTGWVASMSYILIAATFGMIAINLRFYLQERSQKMLISGIFGHYLSPAVIKILVNNPDKLSLGGERREMTAFFSDIAAFSSFSEKLQPEELVNLLNEYLTAMCDIIIANGGVIDKFEGDAIIAFWGAPLDQPEHALSACIASIRMQQFMQEFTKRTEQEKGIPLKVRMGINSGPMVVGNMGSRQRMDYTIMGDAVNLASRLEGANKFFGSRIMISAHTKELAGDTIICRELDTIRVVGKNEPVSVHEVITLREELSEPQQQLLATYQQGIDCYKQRNFQAAIGYFEQILQMQSDDGPSRVYIDRCQQFLQTPPAADWDGVTTLSSKG